MSSLVTLRPTTVPEAVEAFSAYLARKRRSELTILKYGPTLRAFAQWAGDRAPGSITSAELDEGFLAEWERAFAERNGRRPAVKTQRNVTLVLSSLFAYLHNYGLLVDEHGRAVANPMLAIEVPRVETGPPTWLRDEEDEKLLEAVLKPSEKVIVWTLRWTGLRLGEALALRWLDIDFLNGAITVARGKGGKARQVPLVPELIPRLREWATYLEERGRYDSSGFVFVTRNGTAWSQQHAELLCRRAGVRAKLTEHLNPHKLRRTFGSHLLNRGLRIEVVSALLGHASVGTTQRYYAALLPETVRAEVLAVLSGLSA